MMTASYLKEPREWLYL